MERPCHLFERFHAENGEGLSRPPAVIWSTGLQSRSRARGVRHDQHSPDLEKGSSAFDRHCGPSKGSRRHSVEGFTELSPPQLFSSSASDIDPVAPIQLLHPALEKGAPPFGGVQKGDANEGPQIGQDHPRNATARSEIQESKSGHTGRDPLQCFSKAGCVIPVGRYRPGSE